jgi:hypothetical protein
MKGGTDRLYIAKMVSQKLPPPSRFAGVLLLIKVEKVKIL